MQNGYSGDSTVELGIVNDKSKPPHVRKVKDTATSQVRGHLGISGIELNANENTVHCSLEDEATVVLTGKFIALHIYYKEKKGWKLINVHVKKLERIE